MNDLIHYMVKSPGKLDELVYPAQIEDNDGKYYTLGCFYILGKRGEPLFNEYKIFAMLDEQIIEARLIQYRKSRNFYRANIDKIGSFIFYAQTVTNQLLYRGSEKELEELQAVRRLRSRNPEDLEKVCVEKKFYFLGYSKNIKLG